MAAQVAEESSHGRKLPPAASKYQDDMNFQRLSLPADKLSEIRFNAERHTQMNNSFQARSDKVSMLTSISGDSVTPSKAKESVRNQYLLSCIKALRGCSHQFLDAFPAKSSSQGGPVRLRWALQPGKHVTNDSSETKIAIFHVSPSMMRYSPKQVSQQLRIARNARYANVK